MKVQPSKVSAEPPARFPTAIVARSDRELLQLAIRAHLHQPAIALWRATEFVMLREVTFGAPVLDLGCGNGTVANALLRSHWPVDGLELVSNEARAAHATGVYRAVVRADGTRSPSIGGAYGAVFSQSVLEHIPDDVSVVREACRLLAPGGRLVFTVPAPAFAERIRSRPGGEAELLETNRRLGHYHYRSLEEWKSLLDSFGLIVAQTDGHLPARTQRAWYVLDGLMTRRLGRRRVLDIFNGMHRRGLILGPSWVAAWTAILWRPFRRSVDEPGGYLIVADAP